MTRYDPPIEDMMLCINELAGLSSINSLPEFEHCSQDIVSAILHESGKFFSEILAPTNRVGDLQGVSLDGGNIRTPPGFKEAYRQLADDGWISLGFPENEGGQGLPALIEMAVLEMMQSANMAFCMCPQLALGAAAAIRANATKDIQTTYLPKIASGEWATAMSLTEPQAGSDLSGIRTIATPNLDHYLIKGQKIFISWADHDMAENILHLVLARTPGAPDGTRGLSLFLVPKILPNDEGSLGARNDFSIVSIEHKLGLHASPTCTVNYGEDRGAIGYLIGQENQGLAAMFVMMNHARLTVGLQGAALVERSYQQALDFAKERIQGYGEGNQGQVAIIHHPDVKRMLMMMKAGAEAIRAIVYCTAADLDLEEHSPDESVRREKRSKVALLTPVIKGWATEFAQQLVQLGLQIHGGMGYVEETGIAQYMRDIRITTVYEGTSAIQAADLVKRKLIKNDGVALYALIREIESDLSQLDTSDKGLLKIVVEMKAALSLLERVAQFVLDSNPQDNSAIGAIAFDFMMLTGIVAGGWQMARAAWIASQKVKDTSDQIPLYQDKLKISQFYVEYLLPQAKSHASVVLNGGASVMSMQF